MNPISAFDNINYIPWLLAGAWGVVIYSLLDTLVSYLRHRKRQGTMLDFQSATKEVESIKIGSETYQVRAAFGSLSIDVACREKAAIWVSSLVVGVLISLGLSIFVPGFLALLVGIGAGYFIVGSFIRSRWGKLRIELEKEIPTLMRNLSGILQTDVNSLGAIQKASQALDPDQALKAWIDYFLDEMQANGLPSLVRLQNEANDISASLGLLVFEIGRMAQTGGAGYAQAFRDAADNLSLILEVRAEAHSEVKSALGLAKVIIAVAVGINVFLITNPAGSKLFSTPGIQLGQAASVVWGVLGWFVIQKMVEEAVQ